MIDRRKHHTQMTAEELERITRRLKRLTFRDEGGHVAERARSWSISRLPHPAHCAVIEFNTNGGDRRVLLRHAATGVCYVASLLTGRLVTAYRNEPEDNHPTLDWKLYDKNLEVEWRRKR